MGAFDSISVEGKKKDERTSLSNETKKVERRVSVVPSYSGFIEGWRYSNWH